MIRRLHLVPIAALVLGAAGWGGVQASRGGHGVRSPSLADATYRERPQRDTQIAVWRTALAADSSSALVLGMLSALHLQRAREGGGWSDYLAAEALARRSLSNRERHNGSTAATLVAVLVAQHRFTEAEQVARALVEREPDVLEYRAILGEVAMERGDYTTADREFAAVRRLRRGLSVAPRLARWHELRGEVVEARRLLERARADAWERRDLTVEVKAWFALRLGEFERRAQHPRRAAKAFRLGLEIEPNDPRILAAMARLAADQRESEAVIEWAERALAVQLDPELILLLADAHAALGDQDQARRLRSAFDIAVSANEGPFHRVWSLALLDRGERVGELLARAEAELRDRKDVHAYDLVAWALFKSGRVAEAVPMMREALRLGTRDPVLERHRAAIADVVSNGSRGVAPGTP